MNCHHFRHWSNFGELLPFSPLRAFLDEAKNVNKDSPIEYARERHSTKIELLSQISPSDNIIQRKELFGTLVDEM